jgi:hypothetical protein
MKKLAFFAVLIAPSVALGAVGARSGPAAARPAPAAAATATAGSGGAAKSAPNAARAASASKVLLFGGSGGAKSAASKADNNVEGNPCKEEYWGCMDQFCMSANDSGGRCACSNDSIKLDKEYESVVAAIETEVAEASRIGNEIEYGGELKQGKRGKSVLDSLAEDGDEEEDECGDDDIGCKIGAAKYSAAAKLC